MLVQDDGAVRTLVLNRPAVRNALNSALLDAFNAALHAADEDPSVDAIVLTGADPAFCAGADLREAGSGAGNIREAAEWHLETPLIGAINGPCITAGLEIALYCDFLVASEHARFADTHARVGIVPGGGLATLLSAAIGPRRAREMSYTGNFVDAYEAHRLGLVNHVVAHADLLPAARALAADVAGNDGRAVRMVKHMYDEALRHAPGDGIAYEKQVFAAWEWSPDDVVSRREAILQRGRAQHATAKHAPPSPQAHGVDPLA